MKKLILFLVIGLISISKTYGMEQIATDYFTKLPLDVRVIVMQLLASNEDIKQALQSMVNLGTTNKAANKLLKMEAIKKLMEDLLLSKCKEEILKTKIKRQKLFWRPAFVAQFPLCSGI